MRPKRTPSGMLTLTTLGQLEAWLRRSGHAATAELVRKVDESPAGRLLG